jgi:hypothetical protein
MRVDIHPMIILAGTIIFAAAVAVIVLFILLI